jgi:hypothetical protein
MERTKEQAYASAMRRVQQSIRSRAEAAKAALAAEEHASTEGGTTSERLATKQAEADAWDAMLEAAELEQQGADANEEENATPIE